MKGFYPLAFPLPTNTHNHHNIDLCALLMLFNNCINSFRSFVLKVIPSLFQSILKLFKVHKLSTPFVTQCDTQNFAAFKNIYR